MDIKHHVKMYQPPGCA